jgi:glyoxylase-like metal-dependent hydrolase (beta-lactamase superfamily II)
MKRLSVLWFAFALVSCASGPTREQGLVQRAADAMGGVDRLAAVRSLSARGTAKQWEPEQSEVPDGEMRFANDTRFEVLQDRGQRASRTDVERRFVYPSPRSFKFSEIVTPDAGFVLGVDTNGRNAQSLKMDPPAHSMSSLRLATAQREGLRATASSLLLAMLDNPSQLRPSSDLVIAGTAYPAVGYGPFIVAFDPSTGLPARVRTLDYDNIWADVDYDVVFSDWREVQGIRAPMHRRYELNGRPVQEVQLTSLTLNPSVDPARFQVPAALRSDAAKPASGNVPWQWVIRRAFIGVYLDSENASYDTRGAQPGLRMNPIAPGVFHVVGGTHNSLIVEMADHLVMVDAPVSDAQSLWVLEQTKQRFPGKPIKWLVLTHHHMDHAGGLRAILAQGATLVVGQGAMAHYRRVLAAPMTRNPDMKPVDLAGVPIVEVPESHVMRDARGREVIAYLMENPHARGMLMAYVPDVRVGFVADLWSPGRDGLPDKINPALAAVVNTVKRSGQQPLRFAGGHGGVGDYPPLAKLAEGK